MHGTGETMKNNLSEFIYIIDRSGSMSNIWDDTVGGYNSLIAKQKEMDGEAYITTVVFDNAIDTVVNHVRDKDVEPINPREVFPRYTTALLDAIGTTIDSVGERLYNTPEEERPSHVVITIITDGYENASNSYTRSQIKEMIELQRNVYSWEFIFIGADIDTISEAKSLGINTNYSKSYTKNSVGVSSVYATMANVANLYRSSNKCTVDSLELSAALNSVQ